MELVVISDGAGCYVIFRGGGDVISDWLEQVVISGVILVLCINVPCCYVISRVMLVRRRRIKMQIR